MKHFFIILAAILLLTSCSKWLDTKPQSQVEKEDLFITESGFQEALNGVYSRATQSDLYGNELTFGFLDILAQNYSITNTDYKKYLQTSKYNYKDQDFINRKNSAWSGLYNAIANCNLILENIEDKKSLLTGNNYKIIKGEALALRAYFHFDALRMFAPSYVSNPNAPAVPYVDSFSNRVTALSSVKATIDKVIRDLLAAKDLLKTSDPILTAAYTVGYPADTANSKELASPSLFLQNRRHHLNYYAVCASLARAYLYENDKVNALSNALEVINAKKFPWSLPGDIQTSDTKKKDRIFYKELVFAWYIPKREDELKERFKTGLDGQSIETNSGDVLFERGGAGSAGGEDFRYKESLSNIGGRLEVQKYMRDQNENLYPLVAPAIRYSELWYIAGECTFDQDPVKGRSYIDTVRNHRGINAPVVANSSEEFLQVLLKESRKEFYAEGQIFYSYKRLNKSIPTGTGAAIPAGNNIFVLPFPDNEIEFGGR